MKKFFSVLLTLCMALNMLAICPTTVFAASDTLTVKANSVEVSPGDEAAITISIADNPGFSYLKLAVDYDSSVLTLKSAKNNNILDNGASYITSPSTDKRPYLLIWSAAGDTSVTGDLAIITFVVSDKASAGTYSIDVTVEECSNQNFEDVSFSVTSKGSVNVKAKEDNIVSIKQAEVKTNLGVEPKLPDTVQATYESGKTNNVAVTWDKIDSSKYDKAGKFSVNGTVSETTIKAVCEVTVEEAPVTEVTAVSAEKAIVNTIAGVAPVMPETVKVTYSDGSTKAVKVTWDKIDSSKYEKAGAFIVNGTIDGVNIKAEGAVTVIEAKIVSVNASSVTTAAGVAPELPNTVEAVLENGKSNQVAVTWNTVDKAQYAKAGNTFEVEGKVDGFDGKAVCKVTVTEAVVVKYETIHYYVHAGYKPTLDDTVTAYYSDGSEKNVKVLWATLGRDSFMTPNTKVEIKGVALDANAALIPNFDNSVIPTAYVEVTEPLVISANKAEAETEVGKAPKLPETVSVNFSNDTTGNVAVEWDAIDENSYAEVGKFVVNGTVSEVGYTFEEDFANNGAKARCVVSVVEKVTETTKPSNPNTSDNTNNDNNSNEDVVIENVKTGENDYAMLWILFVSSVLAICCVVITRKYYNSECK